jgi:hypothetical protein
MTAARPLAKEMNRTISQVVEHKNLTLKPQVLAPTGSISQRLTNEPGRTVFFNPINGAIPQWREIPALPSYVENHLNRIEQKLDRLFNRMPTQRDQLPARIDSAGGIDTIHESVADQLTPVIRRLEAALARAGMLMVKLAQVYYIEPRLLKIKGPNGAVQVRKFLNADLEGRLLIPRRGGLGSAAYARRQADADRVHAAEPADRPAHCDEVPRHGRHDWPPGQDAGRRGAGVPHAREDEEGRAAERRGVRAGAGQVQAMMMDPNADPDGDGIPDSPQGEGAGRSADARAGRDAADASRGSAGHLDVLTSVHGLGRVRGTGPAAAAVCSCRAGTR